MTHTRLIINVRNGLAGCPCCSGVDVLFLVSLRYVLCQVLSSPAHGRWVKGWAQSASEDKHTMAKTDRQARALLHLCKGERSNV